MFKVLLRDRILATIDFRDFYARRLRRLKEAPRGWARARCPFHNDRGRALVVDISDNSRRGSFRCRRCRKSGDIFSFVMAQDNVGFREAVQTIAAEVGLDVDGWSRPPARADPGASHRPSAIRPQDTQAQGVKK
jgi:DNA primase